MRRFALLLTLLLVPETALAQRTVFRTLLDGYVRYRPTAAWRVLRTVADREGDGVLLGARDAADSGLSALLIAYPRTLRGSFEALTDSLLQAHAPGNNAVRTGDRATDSLRVVLWTADSPSGRLLAIDRLVLLPKAVVYARVAMPAIPPADPDQIPLRLEVIDDLLTTIHADGRVLFPSGAQFAIKVF